MASTTRTVALITTLAAALLVSGCASASEPESPDAPSPTASSSAGTPTPTPTPSEEASAAGSICALLTDAEVTAILGAAYPAALGTFGTLSDPTGGQCLWTNDPEGDVFTDDGSTLELIAFVPDGPNPPPSEAPALGSSEIVATDSGSLFATSDHVFWIRVTGALSMDAGAIDAARALIPAVLSRL